MSSDIFERIRDLREKINLYDYHYYVLSEPLTDDFQYDILFNELERLEREYPQYSDPNSPTQRVGSDLTKKFETVKHIIPMLSLSNTYNEKELFDFDRRIKDLLGISEEINYCAELKIDGASLNLTYINGVLSSAATRGDGLSGEEILSNVKTIKSIPLILKDYSKYFEGTKRIDVRGEVFIEKEAFLKLNEERQKEGEKVFANPRNSAAGTLKLQDPKIVASRPLDIFVYYLIANNSRVLSQVENLELLKKMGFKINPHYRYCVGIAEVINYCRDMENLRDSLPYEIDGVVVKADNFDYQKELGSIARSPRWAVSYKFKAKQAETLVNNIIWQVGRTGAVTPVAELEPVVLSGSTISRATLHNYDEIKRKDIRISDTVLIEKGGDVIPKVVEVVLNKRPENSNVLQPPEFCPVCNSKLYKPENEILFYCENVTCPAQIKGALEHFASRNAMDIEGLGERIIDIFVEKGFLRNIADVYKLKFKRTELLELERFGEKSVDNLLQSIEKSKSKPFHKVLFALGIRYVGEGAARKLADYFKDIKKLIAANSDEVEQIHDIGKSVSESLRNYFGLEKNLLIIKELENSGLQLKDNENKSYGDKLKNWSFVITGTLEKHSREEIAEIIIKNGGKVSGTVSKKTDYVLAGDKAGSKLEKAEKLGIKIISETELLDMIK